ncbi:MULTISPECIES: LysR substrate-binding domain-containing protein [Pseudomonas]|jgi:LysR family transcriptional activator of mexEF-oprN operon|uniref:LysR substrate-binding domain-containing protein n=1 Tax=Pseudomonas TaxID=286 RepID=UPI000480E1DD|nr:MULTISPECIES: LysR substrate-binding domain-containing protein [Pseudomonas]MBF6037411.1 LysR family transcriptional regulator [Pseudomonas mucoides]CRL47267.1 HTH-type transcriptional regulator SyrM 1 [Pseudomonas sp. URMO17WK12:I11]
MNRNDLRRVDMNLLVIFETLMFEKNLTRAGEKLFLGQPAVSASLAKLRDLFDDPLLVRNGRTLEPTLRALAILKELQPAMDTISGAVSRAKDFDPSTSRDVFRIGLSDDAEFGLFPPLLKQIREEAQNVVVVVRRVNFLLMSSMLASGEISVGISYTTELPANAKRKKLRDLSVKILRGDDRPGVLTLDEFCERPHALVSFSGDLTGAIDNDLARIGRSRRVVLAVPQFAGLRSLLAGTDLLASVPDYAACALIEGSSQLRADDPPFDIVLSELSMVWNGVNDNDPAERWLRSKIAQYMAAPLPGHAAT